jgi:LysM repeat protein
LIAKSLQNLERSPMQEPTWQMETKRPTAALLRIAPANRIERPIRWWIISGVITVFGLLIAANYWVSQKGQADVAAKAPQPIATSLKPPTVVEPLIELPEPRLSTDSLPSRRRSEPEETTVPIAPFFASGPQAPRYVIIQEGQSLSRIARANHLSVQALAAANHLEPPYRLKAGARLLVSGTNHSDHDPQTSADATPPKSPEPH